MARPAQGQYLSRSHDALRLWGVAVVAVASMMLSACASGYGGKKAEVDPAIQTGSTADPTGVLTSDQRADQYTIRNAVSAADVESLNGASVPWANSETGSRGVINSLVEEKGGDASCRAFTTSRERFDGVTLFKGRACMVAPGAWAIETFQKL